MYEMRFKEHLNSLVVLACLHKLIQLSLQGNVTIMCIEDTPEKCHRRLVAEACRKLAPELEIVIKWMDVNKKPLEFSNGFVFLLLKIDGEVGVFAQILIGLQDVNRCIAR